MTVPFNTPNKNTADTSLIERYISSCACGGGRYADCFIFHKNAVLWCVSGITAINKDSLPPRFHHCGT